MASETPEHDSSADALPPLSAFGVEDLVIPDDASALAAEAEQLRQEWAATGQTKHLKSWARHQRIKRLPGVRRVMQTNAVSVVFGLCLLMVVFVFAALPTLTSHNILSRFARPQALANSTVAVGSPGGLLPDLKVTVRGSTVSLRDLRPAVFVFLPPSCACAATVRNVVVSASPQGIAVYLVDTSSVGNQAQDLSADAQAGADYAAAVTNTNGLLNQYLPKGTGVTGIFIGADGTVVGPPLPLTSTTRTETWLDRLAPR